MQAVNGNDREDAAAAVAAAIATVWAAAELSILAALAGSVKAALPVGAATVAGISKLQRQAAAILAAAERSTRQVIERAGIPWDYTPVLPATPPPPPLSLPAAAPPAAPLPAGPGAALPELPPPGPPVAAIPESLQPEATAVAARAAQVPTGPSIADMIEQVSARVYRDAPDVYQQAVTDAIESTRGGLPGTSLSLSRIQAAQKALDDLTGRGITGFTDRAGRNWDLLAYVEMATRTAVSNAYDNLQAAAMIRGGADLVLAVTFSPEGSCPRCLPWLGKVLSLTGATTGTAKITDAAGTVVSHEVAGTLAEAKAAGFRHPNCFPAEVIASAPSGVRAAYSHWYEGDLVVIHTASGDELPVTPNHPVLTPEGWVGAGSLTVGQGVFRYDSSVERVGAVSPGDQQVPARIGDVFDALRQASPVPPVRVPAAAEQFHGDGGGSDVEVVLADGLLQDDLDAAQFELAADGPLVVGGTHLAELLADRASLQVSDIPLGAADSIVGGLGELGTLCRRHARIAAAHGLALADLPAAGYERGGDLGAVYADLAADFRDGEPGVVEPGRFGYPGGAVAFAEDDASVTHPAEQGGAARADRQGDLRDFGAVHIAPDCVVKIERRSFAGHVYNLQTGDGWYAANGIVVHNCRCGFIPFTPGADLAQAAIFAEPEDKAAEMYEASQRQRAYEREIRQAGREEHTALTPTARNQARRRGQQLRREAADHRARTGLRMTKVGVRRREHPTKAH